MRSHGRLFSPGDPARGSQPRTGGGAPSPPTPQTLERQPELMDTDTSQHSIPQGMQDRRRDAGARHTRARSVRAAGASAAPPALVSLESGAPRPGLSTGPAAQAARVPPVSLSASGPPLGQAALRRYVEVDIPKLYESLREADHAHPSLVRADSRLQQCFVLLFFVSVCVIPGLSKSSSLTQRAERVSHVGPCHDNG